MSLKSRLRKLEKVVDVQGGSDLQRHWERVCNERIESLARFFESMPDTYGALVEESIPILLARLMVAGPAWPGRDDSLFIKWAIRRAAWGDDHPFNLPPPNPVPTTLIDLFLAQPQAEIGLCPGCEISLPFTEATGKPGVDFVRSRCLTDTCPVCGVHIPPPRDC